MASLLREVIHFKLMDIKLSFQFCPFQAVQALGTAIYKALDYGLSSSEEPHLAPDLEEVIDFMTNPEEDDEGIDQCIFQDIIDVSLLVKA